MFERRRVVSYALGAGLALSMAACGGDGGGITRPPDPTPTPLPAPRVVSQANGISLEVDFAFGAYFDVSPTGTIDATVDYTFADTLLFVWIAKGQCTADQFEADQCQYVATSFTGGKPRRVSAAGQTAGTYTLIVGNLGPRDEAVSYQVLFTATAAGAAPPAASGRGPAEGGFRVRLPSPPPGR